MAADQVAAALDAVAVHPAVLRSLGQALSGGAGALLAGAPPAAGKLVNELRRRGRPCQSPPVRAVAGPAVPSPPQPRAVCAPAAGAASSPAFVLSCGVVKTGCRPGRTRTAALCLLRAPPKRPCARCGRTRVVALRARTARGTCATAATRARWRNACLRPAAAVQFPGEGRPICISCSPRRQLACAHCGELKPPCAHWPRAGVRTVLPGCQGTTGLLRRLLGRTAPGVATGPWRHPLRQLCRGPPAWPTVPPARRRTAHIRTVFAYAARWRSGPGSARDGPGPLSSVRDAWSAPPSPTAPTTGCARGSLPAILADVASGGLGPPPTRPWTTTPVLGPPTTCATCS